MAQTTAVRALLDQLVSSITPLDVPASVKQRTKDAFLRRARAQTYVRTNQFEIEQRLDGLEEKFQIFNNDSLSDALHAQRRELQSHGISWISDVLALVLGLSEDPAARTQFDYLGHVEPSRAPAPLLKWSEIEINEQTDRRDTIWDVQDFGELSSDEDDLVTSSEATSPDTPGESRLSSEPVLEPNDQLFAEAHENEFARLSDIGRVLRHAGEDMCLTELAAIREIMFMLQGHDTTLFSRENGNILPQLHVRVHGLSQGLVREVLTSIARTAIHLDILRNWLQVAQKLRYVQTLTDFVSSTLVDIDSTLSTLHSELVKPKGQIVVSFATTLGKVVAVIVPVLPLSRCLETMRQYPNRHTLDVLLDGICMTRTSSVTPSAMLESAFFDVLRSYLKPVCAWLNTGFIDSILDPIFIGRHGHIRDYSRLWHEWFSLSMQDSSRQPPRVFRPLVHDTLAAGKTVCFLRHLDITSLGRIKSLSAESIVEEIQKHTKDDMLPFSPLLCQHLKEAVFSHLSQASCMLRDTLGEQCGLWSTLNGIELLYLGKNGPVTDSIDTQLFRSIDRCNDAWNDRFLVAELFEERFQGVDSIADQVLVHSKHTSSRAMEYCRQSVKLLENLSVDYIIPWPLANILSRSVMASYRRVALFLMQVRRARYALLRRAHFFVHRGLLHTDAGQVKITQILQSRLLLFVDALYSLLTQQSIGPQCLKLKAQLRVARTVDAMIVVFETHAHEIELACLTAKKLKPIRDIFITLLDLCIRFADVVSAPATSGRERTDFETSSFASARSRDDRKKRSADDNSSSEQEQNSEDECETGYSSFAVLDSTTPQEEIQKIHALFERSALWCGTALRAMIANNGEAARWASLADQLDWKHNRKSMSYHSR